MERGRWPPPTATARAHPHRELHRAQPTIYLLKHFLHMMFGILWVWLAPALFLYKFTLYKINL